MGKPRETLRNEWKLDHQYWAVGLVRQPLYEAQLRQRADANAVHKNQWGT